MKKIYNFACLGDSITSDEVSGIGTLVCKKLDMNLIGNFAHGNATLSDWYDGEKLLTTVNTDIVPDEWYHDNTLSNQVFSLLQTTTKAGKNISWIHPIVGECSENLSGVGDKEIQPDIIYIAIGINDGKINLHTSVFDDCREVFCLGYEELKRNGMASSLRWAIETLRSAYPNALVFVASPLQTNTGYEPKAFSANVVTMKREIIRKVCAYCSVHFIDSYAESGFSSMLAAFHGDGVHPDDIYKQKIASFVAHKIKAEIYEA